MSIERELTDNNIRGEMLCSVLSFWNLNCKYRITPRGQLILFIDGILHAVTDKEFDPSTEIWHPVWSHSAICPISIMRQEYAGNRRLKFVSRH
jgi:hypothetical protein